MARTRDSMYFILIDWFIYFDFALIAILDDLHKGAAQNIATQGVW